MIITMKIVCSRASESTERDYFYFTAKGLARQGEAF